MLKIRPLRLLLFLTAGLLAPLALNLAMGSTPARANAAVLGFPAASCTDGPTSRVSFSWTPAAGASEVWLDLSLLDNGFAPGTFEARGPLPGGGSSYAIPDLKPGQPYVWRVNSLTPDGWQSSEASAFVPCGAPALLTATASCNADATSAVVRVRWAPASPAVQQQFVEVSTSQVFRDGTFTVNGPLSPAAQTIEVNGAKPNTSLYTRITSRLPDGGTRNSAVRSLTAYCNIAPDGELRASSDRLVIPRIRVDAPVNVRQMFADGFMGNPAGKDDVVRYDFTGLYGLGGYPGEGGTTVLAGHLDYRPNFQAVFWDLQKLRPGDPIEYYKADGSRVTYSVSWVTAIPSDDFINYYLSATNPETMVLITCGGTFNEAARNYDRRIMVYAVINP